MNLPRHPLSVLTLFAAPFVLYAVRRTGYTIQAFDSRLLSTSYVWAVCFLTCATLVCCICYRRTKRTFFSVAAGIAVAAFLALQATHPYRGDYKLWTYVVAPVLAWSVGFSFLGYCLVAIGSKLVSRWPNPCSR